MESIGKKKTEEKEAEKKRAELRLTKISNKEKRTRPTSHKASAENSGLQHKEISSNECAACIGVYDDDILDGESSGFVVQMCIAVGNRRPALTLCSVTF